MRDLSKIYDLLSPLSNLADNWDGHFAKPPSSEYINFAAAVLLQLPYSVLLPEVTPSTEGGVILEWEIANLMVIIDERIEVIISNFEHTVIEGDFDYFKPDYLVDLLLTRLDP